MIFFIILFQVTFIFVLIGIFTGCNTPDQVRITDEHRAAVEKADKAFQVAYGTPGQEYAGRLNRPYLKKIRKEIKGDKDTFIHPRFERDFHDLTKSTKRAMAGPTWPLPPVAKVPYTKGSVKFDGRIDEGAWKNALTYKGAYPYNTKDYTESPQTIWKLMWDEKYLYVAYQCEDANLLAEKRDRDGAIWDDDCVEIFILPNSRFRTYWEFIINPYGSIYDSIQCKHVDLWGFTGDPA